MSNGVLQRIERPLLCKFLYQMFEAFAVSIDKFVHSRVVVTSCRCCCRIAPRLLISCHIHDMKLFNKFITTVRLESFFHLTCTYFFNSFLSIMRNLIFFIKVFEQTLSSFRGSSDLKVIDLVTCVRIVEKRKCRKSVLVLTYIDLQTLSQQILTCLVASGPQFKTFSLC